MKPLALWLLLTERKDARMPIIDSDAHVIETLETWGYIPTNETAHTPLSVTRNWGPDIEGRQGETAQDFWVIDCNLQSKMFALDHDAPEASRTLSDVEKRLEHMDQLGVDIQVLYPTVFLRPLTKKPDLQYTLYRSYNRWLADIWSRSKNRLRWVAMAPLLAPEKLRDELVFCKENGAVGIFLSGQECDRVLSDPWFFSFYELAQELNMAVCPHSASNCFTTYDFYKDDPGFNKFKLATIGSFHSLIWHKVPQRFPEIRWGWIEVSSQWVPYVVNDLMLRFKRRGEEIPKKPLKEWNMWVACQVTDDLDWVLKYAGEDNLVVGSDYGHADTSAEIEAIQKLKENGSLPAHIINKILDDNARALYGIE